MTIQEQLMAKMPIKLFEFLDTLTGTELNQLNSIDPKLVAKVYQAGAVFAIDSGIEIAGEAKNGGTNQD